MPALSSLPLTLAELRASKLFSEAQLKTRTVKDEMRSNLMARLQSHKTIFPGIIGYEDTVIPQIVNAVLSKQNFILLGLRGQAKSRILRALTALLDERLPYMAGCEIRDNPYHPLCKRCRDLIAERGDATPIAWLSRDDRYVEKLATPDVTVADLVGDLDPIKAARVDTPTRYELIASSHMTEEIKKYLTADSLSYLSIEGLKNILPNPEDFCTACFDNKYPIEFPGRLLEQMELAFS